MTPGLSVVPLLLAPAAHWLLGRYQRAGRRSLGLGRGGLACADDSLVRRPTLRSERRRLAGRPDLLEKVGGAYVPVEHKPSARRLQQPPILRVAARCVPVEEIDGVRPPHGVAVPAGGARERVTFSRELERGVLRAMEEMRRVLASGAPPRPAWTAAECRACGFQRVCWDQGRTDPETAPASSPG